MYKTGTAYLLWLLCFVGLCGIHRFYCGKWISGLIWIFTGGLLLVGQIIDLVLIPGMVERANARHADMMRRATA
jgi:TM2 domain-containing membrane protein YozV